VRAFVFLASDDESREYHSIETVLRSADSRDAMLDEARRELAAFERKYHDLTELAEVFAAADKLLEVA
jgi:hypothetical protein